MARKVVFLILFILTFSCLSCTCFATNLTGSEFRNLLKSKNIEIADNLEIPSSVTTILNDTPVIILNNDKSKVIIFGTGSNLNAIFTPLTINSKLQWCFGLNANTNNLNVTGVKNGITYYGFYQGGLTDRSMAIFDVESQSFSSKKYFYQNSGIDSSSTYKFTRLDYTTFDLIYDSEEYTQNDFISTKFIKNYLYENLIFSGRDNLYSNSTNLLYKFDGIFTGNGTQEPYTSSFTANNTALKFEYTAYTDLTDYNVVNYFYLQEFTPSEAVNLTDEDLNFTDSDEQIVVNEKLESNFSYTSMIRRMQQGYIYRLYCFSNQHNESGDLIRTTDTTSCFFSLNTWKSNAITVLNIYDLLFPENPDIEQEGGTSSGVIDLENIQNGVNDINNFLNEDISSTSSGDLENALNVNVDIDDPTADFFTWFFNQIVDCFTVDSNQILTFTILEKEFKINSDDYILDIPVLQNVIGVGSSIFIFYGIFQDIRREIEKIKEGKFEEIANEDISANMM